MSFEELFDHAYIHVRETAKKIDQSVDKLCNELAKRIDRNEDEVREAFIDCLKLFSAKDRKEAKQMIAKEVKEEKQRLRDEEIQKKRREQEEEKRLKLEQREMEKLEKQRLKDEEKRLKREQKEEEKELKKKAKEDELKKKKEEEKKLKETKIKSEFDFTSKAVDITDDIHKDFWQFGKKLTINEVKYDWSTKTNLVMSKNDEGVWTLFGMRVGNKCVELDSLEDQVKIWALTCQIRVPNSSEEIRQKAIEKCQKELDELDRLYNLED